MRLRQGVYGDIDDNFVWDDIARGGSSFRTQGVNAPTLSVFLGGIRAWEFSATQEQEFWVDYHIPHTYRPGSAICPHFHVSAGNSSAIGNVVLGFEFSIAKGHHQSDSVFPSTTSIEMTCEIDGTAYKHYVFEYLPGIVSAALEPDTIVMARCYRKGNAAADTLTATLFILEADLHFQKSRDGTRLKTPHSGSFDL